MEPNLTKKIPLTQGLFATVDAKDFDQLNQFKWCAHKNRKRFYAVRNSPEGKTIRMHAQILGISGADHEDGDGLNNTRKNLRPASVSENRANMKKGWLSSSRFKGVSWIERDQIWRAQCGAKRLGSFLIERDAAAAYNASARKQFGEFANLNNL